MNGLNWSDYERGWLSAAIDSEGHITITREKRPHFKAGYTYIPVVGVANKSLEFIQYAHHLIGGGTYHCNKKGVYNLTVSPKAVAEILPKLTFIVKERQKLLVLEAYQIISRKAGRSIPRTDFEISELERIWNQVMVLNNRRKFE